MYIYRREHPWQLAYACSFKTNVINLLSCQLFRGRLISAITWCDYLTLSARES